MARAKQQVFVYATDGSYVQTFPSGEEFRNNYYPEDIGKRPLFQWEELGFEYHINFSREIIAFRNRPGREKTKLILAIHNSEYCRKMDEGETPVQVFNLKGELIAEFKSQRILTKLTGANPGYISDNLNKNKYVKKITKNGLFFKYKKDGTEE